ncbi:MAG: T9SS type A sorting domain-containing protein [Saprospiraceae bacterium]|nr:T9SS type A sorting domain-containing protein [Saprospiraceae bacterium]
MRTTQTMRFGVPKTLCILLTLLLTGTSLYSQAPADSSTCFLDTVFVHKRNADALQYRVYPSFDSLQYRYAEANSIVDPMPDSLWMYGTETDSVIAIIRGLEAETKYGVQVRIWCTDSLRYTAWSELQLDSTRCPAPDDETLSMIKVTNSTAEMGCSENSSQYEWVIRKVGYYTWRHVETSHGHMKWSGLVADCAYEWQVRVKCGDDWSDYTSPQSFWTNDYAPSCDKPTAQYYHVGSITHHSAKLSCDMDAAQYMWAIVRDGGHTWSNYQSSHSSYTWGNLHQGYRYGYKVKIKCHNGLWSDWSEVKYFTTGHHCATPYHSHLSVKDLTQTYAETHCEMPGKKYHWGIRKKGTYEWHHHTTTKNHHAWTPLSAGTKYEFKVKVECEGGLWTGWSPVVWFETKGHECYTPTKDHVTISDLKHDHVKLLCEMEAHEYHWAMRKKGSYDWIHKTTSYGHYSWSSLWHNTAYEFKVKVKCHNGYWSDWSPVKWFTTKHHSYCNTPTNAHLKTSDISHNYIKTHCEVSGKEYHWSFRKYGSSEWHHKTTNWGYHGWSGLWHSTKYEWKVKVKCHDGYWTGWSSPQWATTSHYGHSCSTPHSSHLKVTDLSNSYAKTHCSVAGKEYHWAFRKHGSSDWHHKTTSYGSHGWSGLWHSTKYEWKVKVKCHDGYWTGWSSVGWFTTHHYGSSCSTPGASHMSVTNLAHNYAKTNCSVDGKEYHWAMRKYGESNWIDKTSSHGSHGWSGLWHNTRYEWKVKVKCHNGYWTNWSSPKWFTTTYGSSSCSTPHSSEISVSNLSHNYAKTHCDVSGKEYHWAIRKYGQTDWIHKTSSYGNLGWNSLWSSTKYEYKVKVKCHNGYWTNWSPVGWFTTHGHGSSSCVSPHSSHISTSNITHNYAKTHCQVSGAEYHWAIRKYGQSDWSHHTSSYNNHGWSSLWSSTKYEYKVKVKCHNGYWTDWSPLGWFTTHSSGYGSSSCQSPSSSQYTAVQETPTLFRMYSYMSAQKYEWAIRREGYDWFHHTTTATHMGWGNLTPNTRYDYKLRVTCNDGHQSNWSASKSFWTGSTGSSARSAGGDPVPYDYAEAVDQISEFTLYPNPAHRDVQVSGILAGQRLMLVNAQGQTILERELTNNKQRIELGDLPSGVYHALLLNAEAVLDNKRLVLTQ